MKIRLSVLNDVPRILEIIDDAKALLKSLNIDQWQNGYPNAAQIEKDISNNESYVIVNEDDTIVATTRSNGQASRCSYRLRMQTPALLACWPTAAAGWLLPQPASAAEHRQQQ